VLFDYIFLPPTTNTHSECVMLIAFPLQQWVHERASVLRYTYIACLVFHAMCWCSLTKFIHLWPVVCLNATVTAVALNSKHVSEMY